MGFAAPVGLSLALFAELLAWAIVAALLVIWRQTFGALFQQAASALRFTVNTHLGYKHTFNLGHIFAVADNAISTWLEVERDGLSIEIGWTWHALKETWEATAKAVEWLTHETDATFDWLERIHLPRTVKIIAAGVLPAALLAKLIAAAVAHLRPQLLRTIRVVEHAIPAKAVTIVRYVAPSALAGPLGIPAIRHEIFGLTRRNLRLSKRLHKVEGIFGAAVFAGLMANALGLGKNWRCITRGNIGKTARRLCGLPTHLLDDLLGVLADVWILENVCVLLPFLEQGASVIGTPLVEALTEVGAGICKGSTAPGALRGPSARLPAPIPSLSLSLV